jgi:antitoxin (DNA-binding transcriptional repressor) of toxin-antitoxin stability system
MVKIVDMHEAKTQLSKLVDEEFIIARNGRPVARVTPIVEPTGSRRRGFTKDNSSPDDFDRMGAAEIAALFGTVE